VAIRRRNWWKGETELGREIGKSLGLRLRSASEAQQSSEGLKRAQNFQKQSPGEVIAGKEATPEKGCRGGEGGGGRYEYPVRAHAPRSRKTAWRIFTMGKLEFGRPDQNAGSGATEVAEGDAGIRRTTTFSCI